MRRVAFLVAAGAALGCARAARAQDEGDPATSSPRPALRVLLGSGDATPVPGGGFLFEGLPYRGSFERTDDGRIVNLVDLEQYLYSVVPREMPSHWGQAALEAQAVCARTYVLQRSNPRRAYDLVPSEADQIYAGMRSETPTGIAAVDATSGQVLDYGGQFAQIAYSSCCGGHTEASSDAWGSVALPYLQGVVCSSCTASPNYRWTSQIPLASVAAAFETQLGPIGTLQNVQITSLDPSGRARGFNLISQGGATVVKGSAFRLAVGARILRSLLITNLQGPPQSPDLTIDGGGLGHGVGLCQWGAQGMALTGASAPAILAWYFPGTQLSDLNA